MGIKIRHFFNESKLLSAVLSLAVLFFFLNCKGDSQLNRMPNKDWVHKQNYETLKETILDLQSMGERRSWEKQKETSLYLQRRLKEKGLQPEIQVYEDNGQTWENITVTFPGNVNPGRKILAVAHYDSTSLVSKNDAPGADDNGSGVAVLLELAEILRHKQNQNTVQLVFFSNEEKGQLGSKAFARKMREDQADIYGVINIDIVGYNAPWAIFSSEIFKVITSESPLNHRVKMLGKMVNNWFTHLFNVGKNLKVMVRSEDQYLVPDTSKANERIGKNIVRWDVGNTCI